MKMREDKPAELIFRQFCLGYKNRDLDYVLGLFTEDTHMWGSGVDEHRVGLKQVEEQLIRDWQQAERSEIEVVAFIPTLPTDLWAAALCRAKITIAGTEHVFEQLRGTLMIKRESSLWKIAHMHASFPDYRNADDGSFPVNAA